MKLRAIGYCRVSSKEQVDGTSLDFQAKAIKQFCKQYNYELVKLFREEGESAKTADRTEFLKAINFCSKKKNNIDVFIVHKIDRFARNAKDFHAIRSILAQYGAELESVTENFDDDPTGKLMSGMLALIAEFDNDIRKERVVNGIKAKLGNGEYVLHPPEGYQRIKKGSKTSIEPNPKTFSQLQKAWRLLIGGIMRSKEIVDWLNNNGFRTSTRRKMTQQRLSKIFHNKLYAGIIEIDSLGIETRGDFKPMISEKDFYLAQEMLEGNSTTRRKKHLDANPDFPLAKILYCRNCRKKLTGGWSKGKSKRYAYYQCWNSNCKNKDRFNAEKDVFPQIEKFLNKTKFSKEYSTLFKEIIMENFTQRENYDPDKKIQLEGKLTDLNSRLLRAKEMVESGVYTIEEYKERKDTLKKDIALIDMDLDQYKISAYKLDEYMNLFEIYSNTPYKFWKLLPVKASQDLLRIIFPKGLYFDGETLRTPQKAECIRVLEMLRDGQSPMVRREGFEPP